MDSIIAAIIGTIVGAALSILISRHIWKLDALKSASKAELETLQELKRALRRLWEASFKKFARREFDAVDILTGELSSVVLRESVMKGAEAQLHVQESECEEEVSKIFQKALNDIKYYENSIHEMHGGVLWKKRINKIEANLKKHEDTKNRGIIP